MSNLRFNRLHFFKKFDPQAEYVVLKDMVLGGVEIKRGEYLDKGLLPIHKVKRLFDTRKITPDASLYDIEKKEVKNQETNENILTNTVKHDNEMPIIVSAGPRWRKVMLGDEQIGKTVGSDKEAQQIIDEWLEEQTK